MFILLIKSFEIIRKNKILFFSILFTCLKSVTRTASIILLMGLFVRVITVKHFSLQDLNLVISLIFLTLVYICLVIFPLNTRNLIRNISKNSNINNRILRSCFSLYNALFSFTLFFCLTLIVNPLTSLITVISVKIILIINFHFCSIKLLIRALSSSFFYLIFIFSVFGFALIFIGSDGYTLNSLSKVGDIRSTSMNLILMLFFRQMAGAISTIHRNLIFLAKSKLLFQY